MTDELKRQTRMHIVEPLLSQMEAEGLSPQGIIYVSGMVTRDNEGHKRVRVTEYNARLGDPEGQLIIPSVRNYSEIAKGIAEGDISGMTVDSDGKSRLVVTGASRGYPSNYDRVKGKRLTGVEEAQKEEGVHLNGAGITYDSEGNPTATGGRVIYSVGEGEHEDSAVAIEIARERAYAGMSHLRIEGENGENDLHYRRDIGMPDIRRAQASRTA
jgi:phosphoribosylamine--glycine ligase